MKLDKNEIINQIVKSCGETHGAKQALDTLRSYNDSVMLLEQIRKLVESARVAGWEAKADSDYYA